MNSRLTRTHRAKRSRKRFAVRFGHDRARHVGFTGNLSNSGMMVRTIRVYTPGTILHIELDIATRTLILKGLVVWARAGEARWLASGRIGMGVKFIDPPTDLMDIIEPIALPG